MGNDNFPPIILFSTPEGDMKLLQDETSWLTQSAMAKLFDVNVSAISRHLSSIYEEGELGREATLSKMETVQNEGSRKVTRNKDFYNLNVAVNLARNSCLLSKDGILVILTVRPVIILKTLSYPEYSFLHHGRMRLNDCDS